MELAHLVEEDQEYVECSLMAMGYQLGQVGENTWVTVQDRIGLEIGGRIKTQGQVGFWCIAQAGTALAHSVHLESH